MGVAFDVHPDFLKRREEMFEAYGREDYHKAAELGARILQDSLAFDAIHICGIALPKLKNYDQGYDFACASLSLTKPRVEWFINCAKTYADERMYVHSMAFVVNGLEAFPDHKELLYQRGINLCHTLAYDDGIQAFDYCLEKYPDFYHARMSKGFALHMLGRYDEAIECYEAVEKVAEGGVYEDVVNNWATLLMELGRRDEALWMLEHKVKVPDRPGTVYNKSFILLGNGVWPEAWHLYKLRDTVQTKLESGIADLGVPMAQSLDDICGKHLVLIHEQGLGDCLQFIRYAPMLRKYVRRLTVGVPRSMERMARRLIMDGDFEVICGRDMEAERSHVANADIVLPMLSSPALFDQRTDNIPNEPYFLPPPDALVQERSIGERDGRLRVGLVWAGASRPDHLMAYSIDRRRSVPYSLLEPLLEMSDRVQFVSLQQSNHRVDDERILQPIGEDYDLLDSAAVIAQLDLVITIDSAMCHLSAALGKRTWMLSRFDQCWRWFWDGRTDSGWYPALKIYQQRSPGEWQPIIERISIRLRESLVNGNA
jgi:tetratricopeptide (TPR) repeat protein